MNNNYLNKQTIINLITQNYNAFVNYVNALTAEEFTFAFQQKWTAGQQVQHLILSVKPLVKILSMDKLSIEQTFGLSTKPSAAYDVLINKINEKLQQGGKAPDRFLPEVILPEQKDDTCKALTKLIQEVNVSIKNFTEDELDALTLPHPLLGNITIREMLYVTIDHAEHHYLLTKQNLGNK